MSAVRTPMFHSEGLSKELALSLPKGSEPFMLIAMSTMDDQNVIPAPEPESRGGVLAGVPPMMVMNEME